MKKLDLSCIVRPKAGRDVREFDTIPCSQHRSTQNRYYNLLGTAPRVSPICLPDVIACDQISQAFPAIFHTGSDEILAVVTAWEQCYGCVCVCEGSDVVPVGSSQWLSPHLVRSSQSNMWIQLREESIDMCFMEMPSDVSVELWPLQFLYICSLQPD